MPEEKQRSKQKQPPIIEEDDEGINNDSESKPSTLTGEHKSISRNTVIDCSLCNGKIHLRKEINSILKELLVIIILVVLK